MTNNTQLTWIEQTLNSQLAETNEDKLRRDVQTAADELDLARAAEADAPLARRRAELNYGLAVNPSNPEEVLRTYYETEAGVLQDQWVKKGNDKFGPASDAIRYLTSQRTYVAKPVSSDTFNSETVADPKKDNINTMYRKSELYAKQDAIVMIWTNIMNGIILSYAIVMVYDLRSNLLSPIVGGTIALTFASVFMLDKIVYALYQIPAYVIQYVGWGADSIHTTAWLYVYVPLVAILLYIIIYNLIV